MFYDKEKLKILYQNIDTLVLGVKCTDEKIYNENFLYFLKNLSDLKIKAQNINSYGEKFIKSDLNLKFGDFLVSSKGIQNYTYLFKNDDIFVSVSTAKFGVKNVYQMKIQFRSKFLLVFGYKKAYEFVKKFLFSIFGDCFKVFVLRFDICCDVTGIRYSANDFLNFRSLRKVSNFIKVYNFDDGLIDNDEKQKFQNFDEMPFETFLRFNSFEGISFGKSPSMFRVYDKVKEISKKSTANYLFKKWENAGFEFNKGEFVFRHECEFGRGFIKKIIPLNCDDELNFIFENLGAFWLKGLEFCKWYDLTQKERDKITNGEILKDSFRKLYSRVDKDKARFHFWDFLGSFNCDDDFLYKHNLEFIPNMEKCKLALKSFVTQVYTNLGYQNAFIDVLMEVEKDLDKIGLNLHQYGLLKVLDRFSDNEKLYNKLEITDNKMEKIANSNIKKFLTHLCGIDLDTHKKEVLKYLKNSQGKKS